MSPSPRVTLTATVRASGEMATLAWVPGIETGPNTWRPVSTFHSSSVVVWASDPPDEPGVTYSLRTTASRPPLLSATLLTSEA